MIKSSKQGFLASKRSVVALLIIASLLVSGCQHIEGVARMLQSVAQDLADKMSATCSDYNPTCLDNIHRIWANAQLFVNAAVAYDGNPSPENKDVVTKAYERMRQDMINGYGNLPPTATFPRDPSTYPESFWDIVS